MAHCSKCHVILSEHQRNNIELLKLRKKHAKLLCDICNKIENDK